MTLIFTLCYLIVINVAETVLQRRTKRIVGGRDAVAAVEFPFLVQLFQFKENLGQYVLKCGGTLITAEWILTAAQCLETDEKNWVFYRHIKVVLRSEYCIIHENYMFSLDLFYSHDDYNPDHHRSDIALLKVKE